MQFSGFDFIQINLLSLLLSLWKIYVCSIVSIIFFICFKTQYFWIILFRFIFFQDMFNVMLNLICFLITQFWSTYNFYRNTKILKKEAVLQTSIFGLTWILVTEPLWIPTCESSILLCKAKKGLHIIYDLLCTWNQHQVYWAV